MTRASPAAQLWRALFEINCWLTRLSCWSGMMRSMARQAQASATDAALAKLLDSRMPSIYHQVQALVLQTLEKKFRHGCHSLKAVA